MQMASGLEQGMQQKIPPQTIVRSEGKKIINCVILFYDKIHVEITIHKSPRTFENVHLLWVGQELGTSSSSGASPVWSAVECCNKKALLQLEQKMYEGCRKYYLVIDVE
jgi:hypothetical protein